MSLGSFPAEYSRRRALVALTSHDIERCVHEAGQGSVLLNDEVHVIRMPLAMEEGASAALKRLIGRGSLRPGMVLVQSPYDADDYEEATVAPERFALERHLLFSRLCSLLGAKKVSIEQVEITTQEGKISVGVDGKVEKVGASTRIDSARFDKFRSELTLCDEFPGASADCVGAEQLLLESHIADDQVMKNLLALRRNSSNPIGERRLTMSLSTESKSNLDVAANLDIPSFVQAGVDYKRSLHDRREYTVKVVVKF